MQMQRSKQFLLPFSMALSLSVACGGTTMGGPDNRMGGDRGRRGWRRFDDDADVSALGSQQPGHLRSDAIHLAGDSRDGQGAREVEELPGANTLFISTLQAVAFLGSQLNVHPLAAVRGAYRHGALSDAGSRSAR